MSTNVTTSIGVEVDSLEVTTGTTEDLVNTNQHCAEVQTLESIIAGSKQEYSIIGDGMYASITTDEAPPWLTSIIDSVVGTAVSSGMGDYNTLVQEVRNAIDSIDVARNTYVEQINITALVDGIVVTRLETLNATLGDTYATRVALTTAVATSELASTTHATDIVAALNEDINSRVTNVETAYAAADQSLATSITSLQSVLVDQSGDLSGKAEAISGLQTYVGLAAGNNPDGTGLLSRVGILEKQNDGVIEFNTDTYDVMIGIEDPNNNTDNDQLDVTQEPYVTWKAADVLSSTEEARASHVGDVYIMYSDDVNGTRTYIRSYKFIKTIPDATSPYSTDTEGYTWAVVSDTDAQVAYTTALQAKDLADSKRRVFTAEPYGPYDKGDLWVDSSVSPQVIKVCTIAVATSGVYNAAGWVLADEYAKDFVDTIYTPDSAQLHRQLDGKVEYYFYDSYASVSDSVSAAAALDVIDDDWDTAALRDGANGNIVYFKDTKEAFWYQAGTTAWIAITDTSIYEALQDAATAKGAADGKVSQFFAWGGLSAPETYNVTTRPVEYNKNENGEYLDSGGEVTTVPGEYVVVQAEQTATIDADDFLYWFTSSTLYRKGSVGWSDKVAIPTTSGDGSYISEGDIVTVFDPVDNDLTVYSFNGASWQTTGPAGIISKSKFFIDLENAVSGPEGLAKAVTNLEITSSAYTDTQVTSVESKFAYDSKLYLGDKYYNSGFGLDSSGVTQTTDGLTPTTAFDSEFWVNAERFVLKSPTYPDISAVFEVTATGIQLGIEHTEATRNNPAGTHSTGSAYLSGDMVSINGASYVAIQDVPASTAVTNNAYWQLLSAKGDDGITGAYSDYLFTRKATTPADPGGADVWYSDVTDVPSGAGGLWSIKKVVTAGASSTTYTDKRVIDAPIVRELTIYSDITTGTDVSPTSSTFNLATNTLTINDTSWNVSAPSITADGQKIYMTTALVTGNSTQTSVAVSWNTATVYAHRVDGTDGYSPIKGVDYDDGIDGNNVRVEYSVDGSSGWTVTLNPLTHKYIRTAVDTNGDGIYIPGNATKFVPEKGVEYDDGDPGTSSYLHIKYSDNGTTFTGNSGEDLGTYIGTYVDSTELDSNTFGAYSWQKYIGDDGYSPVKGVDYDDGIDGNNVRVEYSANGTTGWTVTLVPGTHKYIRTAVDSNGDGNYVAGAAAKFVPEEGVEYTVTDGVSSYLHIKYSDNGTTFTGSNGEDLGIYIGTRVDNTLSDSNTFNDYTWQKYIGDDGYSPVKGIDYDDGVAGNNVRVEYSVDGTGSWTTTLNPVTHKYIRTAVDTNGNGIYVGGNSSKFIPEKGVEYDDGNDGTSSYLHIKYSDNGTTFTGNGGETLGTYIGTYVDNTELDSSTFNDYVWRKYIGEDGYDPVKGVDYDDGIDGNNVRVEYSADGTTGWTTTLIPGTHKYIRTAVDTNGNGTYVPGNASKFVPELGVEYTVTNGVSSYLHIKYSDNGTTFTSNSGETLGTYIGTLVDNTLEDSPTFGDYTWKKYVGEDGDSYTGTTEYYKLTNSATTPTIASGSWLTTPQIPTANNQYLWNYNLNTRTIGADIESPVSLITQYVKDGKGIVDITEAYQLGTSATVAPTGSWASTFAGAGAVSVANPYMWNRTTTSYTEGTNTIVTTMIAAKGDTGAVSTTPGPQGDRGNTVLKYSADLGTTTTTAAAANCATYWNSVANTEQVVEIDGDTLIVTNTNTTTGWMHIYDFNGTSWVASSTFVVAGNQIVEGTVTADKIAANSVTAGKLEANIILGTDATFKGTLEVKSAASGERIEILGDKISVYDSAGVLRVRIGNLA